VKPANPYSVIGVASLCRTRLEDTRQMGLAKHDDMVGALAASGSDQPFGDAVLPGISGRDRLVTDAHCS
jgi:hypothetical protein